MSLIFYYAPMSTASITELVLAELDVPCEKVRVDLKKGETRKPDFRKMNPNGKVPLLVHDGTPIWESAAITLYLGETFGVEKKLYPPPGTKRGEAMKWVVWTNVSLVDAIGRFARNTMSWTPEEQHNAKAAEAAKSDIADCLAVLDGALEGREFLLGEHTLVDTHLHSIVDWLGHMQTGVAPSARVHAWSQRCAARPAYAKVMAASAP